jgi:glucosylglycerate synthase
LIDRRISEAVGFDDLEKEIARQVEHLGQSDIVVGIPSYNNARTIGHVVKAVQVGLAKYFPDMKAILVNSDGGSTDGTTDVVQDTAIDDFHTIMLHHEIRPTFKITTPYHGIPGKGSAFRTIFEIASALGAKACAVVDSDLRSITPEWVELLIKPQLDAGYDYVAPLYQRHKFDGTITNSIVYPLTRALYGKRIRQPIGGDFGFSGKVAAFYLTKDVWNTDVARYGIDIWMTTTAVANNFRVCQSYLGAKIHDPKDPGSDLSSMLNQVVGATIDLMETYSSCWRFVGGSEPVPTFGFHYEVGLEPVHVDLARMIDRFRLGAKELGVIWKTVLPARIVDLLGTLSKTSPDRFTLPDQAWVEIVYSFALAAHKNLINRDHLLKSLTPLYIGRTASFVIEAQESTASEVEEKIEGLCRMFEDKKRILTEIW